MSRSDGDFAAVKLCATSRSIQGSRLFSGGVTRLSSAHCQSSIRKEYVRVRRLSPAWAETEPTLEETVAELSERLSIVEIENAQLRKQINAAHCCTTQANPMTIDFSGRIHVDHWAFSRASQGISAFESGISLISPQDRLELRRARFASEGALPLDVVYKLDFELSEAADPEFRDLYIGFNDRPILGEVRFGNQNGPMALITSTAATST